MNITVEKQPDCTATIRVEFPREKVESQREQVAKLYHQSVAVPGFRPGKAPLALVTRRYSKQIEQELKDRLIGEGYREGSKKDGLEVIAPLNVKDPSFNEDGSFTFEVQVIVAPEFELPEYKGLTIKVPKVEVTDENIDQAILALRERAATYPKVEGRVVAEGDVAVIDYNAFVDGRAMREVAADAPDGLQHGANHWVRVKEPNFLPGFTAQLVGLSVGETKQIKVTLPEDFYVSDLANKEVTYEVTLKELREQVLPEVNDDFVRGTGIAETADGFREAMKKRLDAELALRLDLHKRQQAVQILNEKVSFPVPQHLVDQATQQRAQELVQANYQRGVSDEEIMEHREEILNAAAQQAQYDVKTNFILNKIAEKENIQVSNQELQQDFMRFAIQTRATRPQIQKLARDKRILRRLTDNIIVRKTLDVVLANAVFEETDPKEFEEALAAQNEAAALTGQA